MLKLSDDEMDAILRAAGPIDVDRRDGFLQAVASALASHPGEVGPGVVHRVCAEVQRQHFDPPDFSHAGSVSKYR
jgi:hypothetical protein